MESNRTVLKEVNGIPVSVDTNGMFSAVIGGTEMQFPTMAAAEKSITASARAIRAFVVGGEATTTLREVRIAGLRRRRGVTAFLDVAGKPIPTDNTFEWNDEVVNEVRSIDTEIDALTKKRRDILSAKAKAFTIENLRQAA